MQLSAGAAAHPAEARERLTSVEREHLRERLETQIARGHLTLLARGFGILSLGPGLVLCGLAWGGRIPGLSFLAALLGAAGTGLGLVFRVLATREGQRLRRLGAASLIHDAPAPWWRPLETGLFAITALTGTVLAVDAVLPGMVTRKAVLKAGALFLGAATLALASLLAESRYSSRRR